MFIFYIYILPIIHRLYSTCVHKIWFYVYPKGFAQFAFALTNKASSETWWHDKILTQVGSRTKATMGDLETVENERQEKDRSTWRLKKNTNEHHPDCCSLACLSPP